MNPKRNWLKILVRAGILIVVLVGLAVFGFRSYLSGSDKAEFWESNIADYEAADARAMPEAGAVLFTGSSSIRLWNSLSEDMAPYRVLNRGFGGAHMSHVVNFAPRIVLPYAPSSIVIYAGDNDIGFGKSAERVVADYEALLATLRRAGLDVPVFYIPIKPSRLRWEIWDEQAKANARIAELSALDPKLHYIDTATPMLALAEAGEPPPRSLFRIDGLHLSEEGYELWARVVRRALEETLGDSLPR